jgi:hypothetical protein
MLPAFTIAAHFGIGEGREQRNNKSSKNKYKETRGTKEETDIEQFQKKPDK